MYEVCVYDLSHLYYLIKLQSLKTLVAFKYIALNIIYI